MQDACHRITAALEMARRYGGCDGAHHKAWVIDQMCRVLLDTPEAYAAFVAQARDGPEGPDTYAWERGQAP